MNLNPSLLWFYRSLLRHLQGSQAPSGALRQRKFYLLCFDRLVLLTGRDWSSDCNVDESQGGGSFLPEFPRLRFGIGMGGRFTTDMQNVIVIPLRHRFSRFAAMGNG